MTSLLLLLFTILLTACQTIQVRDEASPRSRIAPGSVVVLHQPLSVPAGHSRVFLQQGKVVAKTLRNIYQPHCDFEQLEVSQGESTIMADHFVVTAVSDGEEEVVRGEGGQHYAALAWMWEQGPVMLVRFVEHTLVSERQPGVMRLTCHGGFADSWEVRYPSVRQIRAALGEVATIESAGLLPTREREPGSQGTQRLRRALVLKDD